MLSNFVTARVGLHLRIRQKFARLSHELKQMKNKNEAPVATVYANLPRLGIKQIDQENDVICMLPLISAA